MKGKGRRRGFRGRKKRFHRRFARKGKKLSKSIITFPGNSKHVFPPRLRCKMRLALNGYHAATSVPTSPCRVRLNALYTPFNIGTALPNPDQTIASWSPTGLVNLFGNSEPYNAYRVYASSIKISMTPESVLDNVVCTVVPADNNFNAAGNAQDDVQTQPYAKTTVFYNGEKRSALKAFVKVHNIYGVSRRAIEDDLSGQFAATVGEITVIPSGPTVGTTTVSTGPIRVAVWVIYCKRMDGGTLNANLPFNVEVNYYVEFFNSSYLALGNADPV